MRRTGRSSFAVLMFSWTGDAAEHGKVSRGSTGRSSMFGTSVDDW